MHYDKTVFWTLALMRRYCRLARSHLLLGPIIPLYYMVFRRYFKGLVCLTPRSIHRARGDLGTILGRF